MGVSCSRFTAERQEHIVLVVVNADTLVISQSSLIYITHTCTYVYSVCTAVIMAEPYAEPLQSSPVSRDERKRLPTF